MPHCSKFSVCLGSFSFFLFFFLNVPCKRKASPSWITLTSLLFPANSLVFPKWSFWHVYDVNLSSCLLLCLSCKFSTDVQMEAGNHSLKKKKNQDRKSPFKFYEFSFTCQCEKEGIPFPWPAAKSGNEEYPWLQTASEFCCFISFRAWAGSFCTCKTAGASDLWLRLKSAWLLVCHSLLTRPSP